MTRWGSHIPMFPNFQSKVLNTQSMWLVTSMMIGVEKIWQLVKNVEMRKTEWHGWLLVYIARMCLSSTSKRQGSGDVFSFKRTGTVEKIAGKFPLDRSASEILYEISGIMCVDLNEYQPGSTYEGILEESEMEPNVLLTYPNSYYQEEIVANEKKHGAQRI